MSKNVFFNMPVIIIYLFCSKQELRAHFRTASISVPSNRHKKNHLLLERQIGCYKQMAVLSRFSQNMCHLSNSLADGWFVNVAVLCRDNLS